MKSVKNILLVEDDPQDIELTITALSEYKLANEIVTTRDGVEALDYLYCQGAFAQRRKEHPAVILLDLKMPKLDGLQVLQRIKTDKELSLIPIVILTSSRESRDLKKCYELGANAYVVKPVRFTEFVEAIKQIGIFWALINEPPPGNMKTQ